MIIGITGAMGSGKTTAAKIFSKHHFTRIDADQVGHEIIKKGTAAYQRIVRTFGVKILDKNKNVDRKKLGDIVFSDAKKLERLNSIVHPAIIKEIRSQITKIKNKCGNEVKIIIDAPLLLETKTKNFADKIIVVKSSKENAFKRLRKKYSKEKIEKILNAQTPLGEKLKHADFLIDNNKDLKYLENQVVRIIAKIKNENCSLSRNF